MKNSKMIKKLLVVMGIVTSVTAVASAVEAKKISDETKKKCEKIQGRNTYSSLFLFGNACGLCESGGIKHRARRPGCCSFGNKQGL